MDVFKAFINVFWIFLAIGMTIVMLSRRANGNENRVIKTIDDVKTIEEYIKFDNLQEVYKFDEGDNLYIVADNKKRFWIVDWRGNTGGMDKQIEITSFIERNYNKKPRDISTNGSEDVYIDLQEEIEKIKQKLESMDNSYEY